MIGLFKIAIQRRKPSERLKRKKAKKKAKRKRRGQPGPRLRGGKAQMAHRIASEAGRQTAIKAIGDVFTERSKPKKTLKIPSLSFPKAPPPNKPKFNALKNHGKVVPPKRTSVVPPKQTNPLPPKKSTSGYKGPPETIFHPPHKKRRKGRGLSTRGKVGIGAALATAAIGSGLAYKHYRDKKRQSPSQYELEP